MQQLLKLLELVRRDLRAQDARAELGGAEPDDPKLIWAAIDEHLRIVAVFDEPPAYVDRLALEARLRELLTPFQELPSHLVIPAVAIPEVRQRELDDELSALAERTDALGAMVIDERSPILWGTSEPRVEGWDVGRMEEAVRLYREISSHGLNPAHVLLAEDGPEAVDETRRQRWNHRFARLRHFLDVESEDNLARSLTLARAVSHVRERCRGGRAPERVAAAEAEIGVFARGLASIYAVVLVFAGPYSELHAEGRLVRVMPVIERLVLALPPVEPPPRGAKVIPLRPR